MSQVKAPETEAGIDPAIISQTPGLVSGAPVFPGTRVPVSILRDYLVGGKPFGDFVDNYLGVSREQAINVIELAFERIIGPREDEDPDGLGSSPAP